MNERMDQEDVVHTVEYYSAMRKEEILPFVTTWMNLEGHSGKQNKHTNTVWSYLYVESKNKSNSQKQSRKIAVRGWKGEENRERLVNGYKLRGII